MEMIGAFFAGALLFNSIPHLVQGICGKSHMTPFNIRSGPEVNIIWGWANLVAGGILLYSLGDGIWENLTILALGIGAFVTSMGLAIFWSDPEAKLPWHRSSP